MTDPKLTLRNREIRGKSPLKSERTSNEVFWKDCLTLHMLLWNRSTHYTNG